MAMPVGVYTLESVNLICGDRGSAGQPGKTTHIMLAELKLPAMEENYVDYQAGGAPVAIEIPTHFNRLESTFNLNGWQPEVMGLIAENDVANQRFTAYGLVRSRQTGDPLQAIAIMQGRLGRVNPVAYRRGDLHHYEFSIRSIIWYRLLMQLAKDTDPVEVTFWNYFTSEFRVRDLDGNTRDVNADMRQKLAIP